MTIKRQLSVSYSALYFVIVGLIILSVSVFTYRILNAQATGGMEALVNNTKNMIEMNYGNIVKNYLKGIAEKDEDIVNYFYYGEYSAGKMSEEQAKKYVSSALLAQKIGSTGYVYCLNTSGVVKVHPKKELVGTNLSENDFIQIQKRDREGYLEYEWANPGETVKREKALYMTWFEPWDWIISVSSYRSEFSNLVNMRDVEKGLLDIKLGRTGYLYVMDYSGKLLIHPTLRGQNISENKDEHGFFYIKDMLARKDGEVTYAWKNPGEAKEREKVVYFRSIDSLGIIIAGGTYTDELISASAVILLVSGGLFVIGFAIVLAVSTFVAGHFSKPLTPLKSMLKEIGRGDLTATLDARISGRRDEIGEIARAAADMQNKLRELTMAVRASAAAVERGAHEIVGSVDEQAATTNQMSASVSEITSTMEELSASSTQIAEHSRSVVDIANQTWENSKKGSQSMTILQEKIEGIRSDNQVSLDEVVELGSKSKEISKVMSIINTVADQTKLIAFNAALEASSAGESGKRFGVVAAEIRRLADSVTESTGEIEQKISEIQDSISRLVITSEKRALGIADGMRATIVTAELLAELVGAASRTTTAAQQISLSTQQQRTASNQVVVALREIVNASQHTADSINRIVEISRDLTGTSERLAGEVGQFKLARDEAS